MHVKSYKNKQTKLCDPTWGLVTLLYMRYIIIVSFVYLDEKWSQV
jgi:hypothetical protein